MREPDSFATESTLPKMLIRTRSDLDSGFGSIRHSQSFENDTYVTTGLMTAIVKNNFAEFAQLIEGCEKLSKPNALKFINTRSSDIGYTALMYVCSPRTSLTIQERFSYIDLLLKAGAFVDIVSLDGRNNARSLLGLLAQEVNENEIKAVQLLIKTITEAEHKQIQKSRTCSTPISERGSISPTSIRTPRTGESRFGADFKYE